MWWAIEYVLRKNLQERDVVILGNGFNALKWRTDIKRNVPADSKLIIIQSLAEIILSAKNHYIVICEDDYIDHNNELYAMGFMEIEDYYDWTKFARTNGHLPIDVECGGVTIGYGSYFSFPKSCFKHLVSIGRFCSIAETAIVAQNHSMNRITTSSLYPLLDSAALEIKDAAPSDKDSLKTGAKLSIGNDVWIGANVFINASKVSRIGDGAVIGTGTLVLDNIPPYAIVYGTPGKVMRYRCNQQQIDMLESVKWWSWDRKTLNRNIELLMYPELFFQKFDEAVT
jgi:aminocyclitol acetyltransferase